MISETAKRHAEMLFGMTVFGWGDPQSALLTVQALIQELDGNNVPIHTLTDMSPQTMSLMLFALLVKAS